MPIILWTKNEDDFLRKNYANLTYDALADKLDRSPAGIKDRARRIGVSKQPPRVRWSNKDHQFLRENYPLMPLAEIAQKLGRTRAAVATRYSSFFKYERFDIQCNDLNEAHFNPFLTGKIGAKPNV